MLFNFIAHRKKAINGSLERDVCVPFLVSMAAVTHQMFEEGCKRSYSLAHGVFEHTLALKRQIQVPGSQQKSDEVKYAWFQLCALNTLHNLILHNKYFMYFTFIE